MSEPQRKPDGNDQPTEVPSAAEAVAAPVARAVAAHQPYEDIRDRLRAPWNLH